jgi:tetratricopeptide (TPR) repeat protein
MICRLAPIRVRRLGRAAVLAGCFINATDLSSAGAEGGWGCASLKQAAAIDAKEFGSQMKIAMRQLEQGSCDEAVKASRRALDLARNVPGGGSDLVRQAARILSESLECAGLLGDALGELRQALAHGKGKRPVTHVEILDTRRLAMLYRVTGNLAASAEIQRLAMRMVGLPDNVDRPDSPEIMMELAEILSLLGDRGALAVADDAAKLSRSLQSGPGIHAPSAASLELRRGRVYLNLRDTEAAIGLLEDLLRRLGSDAGVEGELQTRLDCLELLGEAYATVGNFHLGRDRFLKANSLMETIAERSGERRAILNRSMAKFYIQCGQLLEAEAAMRRVREMSERKKYANRPEWEFEDRLLWARVNQHLGRLDEAIVALREAVSAGERAFGRRSPRLTEPLKSLMAALRQQRSFRQASDVERSLSELVEMSSGMLDP